MVEEKSSIYLVSIVALVAIVGIVFSVMTINGVTPMMRSHTAQPTALGVSNQANTAGQGFYRGGKIVPNNNTCTDSDGGLNFFVKGVTQNSQISRTDQCYNVQYLTEFYCDGNSVSETNFSCPPETVCEDGKCSDTTSSGIRGSGSSYGGNPNLR